MQLDKEAGSQAGAWWWDWGRGGGGGTSFGCYGGGTGKRVRQKKVRLAVLASDFVSDSEGSVGIGSADSLEWDLLSPMSTSAYDEGMGAPGSQNEVPFLFMDEVGRVGE
uniref:Uncharacterized protein n=1 Tax=Anguilla anguilla TaxID=7936 RepID=A0A0E9R8J1_ANGAN